MATLLSLIGIFASLVGGYRLLFTEDVLGGVYLLLRGFLLLVMVILFEIYKHSKDRKK